MKRSKRYAVCALMLCVCLAALSGCHGAKGLPEFAVPESFDTTRTYEIVFWAKNDTNKTQTRIYEKAIENFEALYPNIDVSMRLYTDYGRIYNDVITNIATNTTPNVCITYPDHIATYLTGANSVVPLDGAFDDPRYGLGGSELRFTSPHKDELVPQFLSECAFDGHYYTIPYMRSTEACYVNKTYVEKLGFTLPETLTWDFVWQVAEAAVKKDASGLYALNGQKVMIPFIYKSTDNMMIQWLRQRGAGYAAPDGTIGIFNDVTQELLYTVAEHAKTGAFSTFKVSSYPANFLNAGQCVFAVDSTAGATWMGANAPLSDISADKFVEFETAVMTVPQADPQNPQMISQGPSVCVFNKPDAQEVLASWLFAQYLLTNDVQIAYAETEGYVPVTQTAQSDPAYREYLRRSGEDAAHYEVKIRAAELLMANTGRTFVTPVFNGSASLRDAAGQLIENTVKAARRKQTVDDAFMKQLFNDVSALYRLNEGGRSTLEDASEGPLPGASIALLCCLGGAWLIISAYAVFDLMKKKKAPKN